MGPGEHRPYDHDYWTQPWSTALFAGDLFAAVPFGDQPTLVYATDEGSEAGKHFVGEIAFGHGLLITPTCDMTDQSGEREFAHPYRTLVPVVPRNRDTVQPYLYLPPLPGVLDEESVACLFRPGLVSDEFLADPS